MTQGDDVAQSPGPTEPKCQGQRSRSVTPEVSEGREGWPAGRPSAPNCLKLVVEILLTSYKYPPYPPQRRL
jgi:hypothetical protein